MPMTQQLPPTDVSPTQTVVRGFGSSLERSLSTFKRMFATEFSQMFRSSGKAAVPVDLHEYTDGLSAEVTQIIETPIQFPNLDTQQLSRKVAVAIDDQTKPMTSHLAETEARQSTANAAYLGELEHLQSEVEALRSVFTSTTDTVIKELEGDGFSIAAVREAEHARARELETRMRTMKLREVELEARSSHQNIERDNIARLEKQYHQKRAQWEDEVLSGEFDEGAGLRQRIVQEVRAIKREAANESGADLVKFIEEGIRMVSNEVGNMQGEVSDLEFTNQYLEARIRNIQKKTTQRRPTSSMVVAQAQTKVDELRRLRDRQ
jgi:hypothetical protein